MTDYSAKADRRQAIPPALVKPQIPLGGLIIDDPCPDGAAKAYPIPDGIIVILSAVHKDDLSNKKTGI